MIKAYKYRLKPNKDQKTFFEKSFGCVRYVYNWSLNLRNEAYADKQMVENQRLKMEVEKYKRMYLAVVKENRKLKEMRYD